MILLKCCDLKLISFLTFLCLLGLFKASVTPSNLPYGQRPVALAEKSEKHRTLDEQEKASFLQSQNILASLRNTDIRGSYGNVISGVLEAVAPNSCVAELINTGYTNDEYGEDDYPYQPSCYNPGGESNEIICFPNSAKVLTTAGWQTMESIKIGTLVASKLTKTGYQFEPVLYFLHREPEYRFASWVQIHWKLANTTLSAKESNHFILSPNHLVFSTKERDGVFRPKAARRIAPGHFIMLNHDNLSDKANQVTSPTRARVVSVKRLNSYGQVVGLHAPVTASGMLIVNHVVVSSFSALPFAPGYLDSVSHYLFQYLLTPFSQLVSMSPKKFGPLLTYALGYLKVIATSACGGIEIIKHKGYRMEQYKVL